MVKFSKQEQEDFNFWMKDGNVSKNSDGSYSTQDAQFGNKLKDMDALKEYYLKEFLSGGQYAVGGEAGFDDAGTSMVMYHEKRGNFITPKGQIYLWLYEGEKIAEKLQNQQYDWVFYPLTSINMAFQSGYIPPLKRVWTKKFQKEHKGSEHLLGLIKAYLIEKEGKKELFIDMMSVNPNNKKEGIMSYMIKDLRNAFNLSQDQVTFSKLTKEGEKFIAKKQYSDGGGIGDEGKLKFEDLVGKYFEIELGSSGTSTEWESKELLAYLKKVVTHNLFDSEFYYNWTDSDEKKQYLDIFTNDTLNQIFKNVTNALNKYFEFKTTAYSTNTKVLVFKYSNDFRDDWIDNWFKTNKKISVKLKVDYKRYREKYAGVTPYAYGGGVGEFPPKGELTNKDNFLLKYEKKGSDYEFFVYKPITKEVSGYNQIKHVCLNKDCPQKMTYEQFIHYLYAELYLDDKKFADGGLTRGEIDAKKKVLVDEVDKLIPIHKKKYGNMPIDSPKSKDEKESEKKIASLFSEINELIILKRKLLKEQVKYADGGAIYPDLSLIKADVVNDSVVLDEFEIKKTKNTFTINGLDKKKIKESSDIVRVLRSLWEKDTINAYEQSYVLYLNKSNNIIGYYHHSSGGIDGTIMDVQMISGMALKSLAKGVIIAHNHPSESTLPSDADKRITNQIKDALKVFNILLLDSIIITDESYFSFCDEGLI